MRHILPSSDETQGFCGSFGKTIGCRSSMAQACSNSVRKTFRGNRKAIVWALRLHVVCMKGPESCLKEPSAPNSTCRLKLPKISGHRNPGLQLQYLGFSRNLNILARTKETKGHKDTRRRGNEASNSKGQKLKPIYKEL